MGAPDVLHLIRESGLTLTIDVDRLIVTPSDRLTDDLRNLIRDNKAVVLNALESEATELTRLVRLCGERYDFTETEHAEALAAALADPIDALTCFRGMAAKPDIAATVAAPPTTGCTSCTHSRKPGRVPRYCSARPDLPPAYGERHPLHCLPADGGTVCEQWGGASKV